MEEMKVKGEDNGSGYTKKKKVNSISRESSDDDQKIQYNDQHYIDEGDFGDLGSAQSSDSDDLEVVESENLPYEKNYEGSSTYQSPDMNKKYYAEYSHNDRTHSVYEGASHFYRSLEPDKIEEEPSYTLDDSPKNLETYDYEELNQGSTQAFEEKSKKKKDRNNASSNSDLFSKAKKRKTEYQTSSRHSKKLRSINNSIENNDSSFSLKNVASTNLSEESSDSDDHFEKKNKHDYTTAYSFKRQSLSPAKDPNISEEDSNYTSFKKSEIKNQKRKSKQSFVETTGLKKRLESSNKGNLLMKKMGYTEGEGLGKHAQGRVEPVELSNQRGRRGLGLSLPGLDGEAIEWDPNLEEINEKEPIDWLENIEMDGLCYETMVDYWIGEGPKNLDIDSMTAFIDEELLSNILKKKSIFDNLSEEELRRAVIRSNPFESLRKGIFLNRAALKMANMDSAFDFMFTNPKYRDGRPMVREDELLYFADVCAGPGGFSEYVLYRKKWLAKGIGFTLKGDNDFKLQDFLAGPSETFEPYYGEKDDGNIFDPANITSLTKFVMKVTDGKGVHFVMADGGFSVKGKENIQELLSKQLYLCQFLVALSILQEEGHFVCKLFDLFSEFSAGLIYLMYRAFHKICIFKPNTSRPANSERYIICKYRRQDSDPIRDYMFEINSRLWKFGSNSNVDINECVPLEIIKDNVEFFNYLRDSNNRLGNRQIVNLDKIAAYYQDQTLHDPLQNDLRVRCLELWKVPVGPRRADPTSDTEATKTILQSILKEKFKPDAVSEILNLKGKPLTPKNMKDIFNYSILDWQCIPLGSDKLCFLLGLGKNRVYRWSNSKWEHESNLELTPGTLIYGVLMPEFRGDKAKQTQMTAFHIIDGFSLGYNKSIAHYPYDERLATLNLYTKALKKWNNNSLVPIRVQSPTALKDVYYLFGRVEDHFLKSTCYNETCLYDHDHNCYMQVKGIVFIRTTREPWRQHISKKHNCHYYYNSESRESLFEKDRPHQAVASAIDSLKNQVLWIFEAGVGFKGEDPQDDVLYKDDLVDFIQKKMV